MTQKHGCDVYDYRTPDEKAQPWCTDCNLQLDICRCHDARGILPDLTGGEPSEVVQRRRQWHSSPAEPHRMALNVLRGALVAIYASTGVLLALAAFCASCGANRGGEYTHSLRYRQLRGTEGTIYAG